MMHDAPAPENLAADTPPDIIGPCRSAAVPPLRVTTLRYRW